jgi:hypothetical protein
MGGTTSLWTSQCSYWIPWTGKSTGSKSGPQAVFRKITTDLQMPLIFLELLCLSLEIAPIKLATCPYKLYLGNIGPWWDIRKLQISEDQDWRGAFSEMMEHRIEPLFSIRKEYWLKKLFLNYLSYITNFFPSTFFSSFVSFMFSSHLHTSFYWWYILAPSYITLNFSILLQFLKTAPFSTTIEVYIYTLRFC